LVDALLKLSLKKESGSASLAAAFGCSQWRLHSGEDIQPSPLLQWFFTESAESSSDRHQLYDHLWRKRPASDGFSVPPKGFYVN